MTANQIAFWNLVETKRSNQAREVETNRANTTREAEENRHNLATESLNLQSLNETKRSNLVREAETYRSNRAQEALSAERNRISQNQVELGYAQLSETQAHNRATESISRSQLVEQHRSNIANEAIGMYNASTAAKNANTNYRNSLISQGESARKVYADIETRRHNRAMEGAQVGGNITQALGSIVSSYIRATGPALNGMYK